MRSRSRVGALPRGNPPRRRQRRVYSLTYEREGDRYEVTVGEKRKRYARRTGPRGGYIKDAGQRAGRPGPAPSCPAVMANARRDALRLVLRAAVRRVGKPILRRPPWSPQISTSRTLRARPVPGTRRQRSQCLAGPMTAAGLVRLHPGQVRDDHADYPHDEDPDVDPRQDPDEAPRPLPLMCRRGGRPVGVTGSPGRLGSGPPRGVDRLAELRSVTRAAASASPRSPGPARFRGGMSRYTSLVTR